MADTPPYAYSDSLSRVWNRGTHALIAVWIMAVVLLALSVAIIRLAGELKDKKPLWVFADEVGRAYPKDYQAVHLDRRDPKWERVFKSELGKFVVLQFQVKKRTVAEDLPKALLFMTADTASRFVAQYRNGYINKLLHDGGPDTQIDVKNVALLVSISQCGEAGEQPCAATVQFVATRDREARDCVVDIQFQREDSDDFDKLLINPLGIAASEFPAQCGGGRQVVSAVGR